MKSSLIAAGAALAAVVASTAAAAPTADVTLSVERFYDPACLCYKVRFSGAIASGAANEYVAVMAHSCGSPSSTAVAVAGASTGPGGSWEVVPGNPVVGPPATYRARWEGRMSDPVTIRVRLNLWFEKLPGRRYRVSVYAKEMRGKLVELQRLVGGRWIRVRTARLVASRQGAISAIFTVRTRRLTMRILIPEGSAGPCYLETATKTWVS